jgi:hypothetical protein
MHGATVVITAGNLYKILNIYSITHIARTKKNIFLIAVTLKTTEL